ncbi:VOC family protein [Deinococcus hopiensis]|uniref:VOC family protein n=1 Tax=Deinococcus hopiensis TaxID=309885 RepID=UPI00111BF026|nr:VOC family protein [Deinococcus hopiensis]
MRGPRALWATPEFAELVAPPCTLTIASTRTTALFGAGAAHPADNHSAITEFQVDDGDAEYARTRPVLGDVALPPTTHPWSNRWLLFRDPDGNMINFFTSVGGAAVRKFKP